jgi:hypothetical protein
MKTQTKTEVRNSTARAEKILRGIDNDVMAIESRTKAVGQKAEEFKKILSGLSNTALSSSETKKAPEKAAPKPAAKPAAKPAQKPAAKKPAPKKPAPAPKKQAAAKPATKAAAKPAAKKAAPAAKPAAKKSAPAEDRPKLVDVAASILQKAGKALPAAEIYRDACKAHGYWSRQSLYNALEKPIFVKKGDGASATFDLKDRSSASASDSEADNFVSKVAADPATSAVL